MCAVRGRGRPPSDPMWYATGVAATSIARQTMVSPSSRFGICIGAAGAEREKVSRVDFAAMIAPSDETIAFVRTEVGRWAQCARRDLPWRETRDPWAIIVSETMLQQTQVARVLPKYASF